VALKVFEVIEREKLADNARQVGLFLQQRLQEIADKYPQVVRTVRGLGMMLGIELAPNIERLPGDSSRTQAVRFAQLLHTAGVLTIPAGAQVLRLLPPLNLRRSEAEEGLNVLEAVAQRLAA
jgi:acetylornithine/succinyldiaminopimelate/putrescine aminotransferase